MTYVRVPKHAMDLRLGDILEGCPDGCRCTGGYHRVHHLRIDHQLHNVEPRPLIPRGEVVVESCDPDVFPPRTFRLHDVVTTLVDVERITPLRGHAQRITASELKARGWYRWYARHDVACSCGWRLDEPVTAGAGYARERWLEHKADAISALLAPTRAWLSSAAAYLAVVGEPNGSFTRYRVVMRGRGGAR